MICVFLTFLFEDKKFDISTVKGHRFLRPCGLWTDAVLKYLIFNMGSSSLDAEVGSRTDSTLLDGPAIRAYGSSRSQGSHYQGHLLVSLGFRIPRVGTPRFVGEDLIHWNGTEVLPRFSSKEPAN